MSKWIRTDEKKELISSLNMVTEAVQKVNDDVEYWKWAVIALSNVMEGVMALSLRSASDLPAKRVETSRKTLVANQPWLTIKAADIASRHRKVGIDDYIGLQSPARAVPKGGEQDPSIDVLLELRNNFIHFLPQGWSLEVSELPIMFISLLDTTKSLMFEPAQAIWNEQIEKDELANAVNRALETCLTLKTKYDNSLT